MTESTFDAANPEPVETSLTTTLEQEIARLETERQDLIRLAQSRQAEFENYRRRSERERQETIDVATSDVVNKLLPIFDDFERALLIQTADASYAKGIELIHGRLKETLTKLGLEPIDAIGTIFDPNLHHGIDLVETDEAEDQTILAELQRGYHFRGRLLRPAMVRVAVKK
ncbi:nucleotide exchange factor GrpE, partial [Bryobacter aggregatus]|uniref:nucleotide exchange factor GrpE n=1 Tax=Bryobacter aggregatus TaxID=360054 RepID=UPI0004E23FD1